MLTPDREPQADMHQQPFPKISQMPTAQRVGMRRMMDAARDSYRLKQPHTSMVQVIDSNSQVQNFRVIREGAGPSNTKYGRFWEYQYDPNDEWGKYHVLVACQDIDRKTCLPIFKNKEELLVRTDSGCTTGQTFHEMTCDCRQQLHQAMQQVTNRGEGIVVHIPGQDGRGRGNPFKLSTLDFQEQTGANTVEAACMIHFMEEVHMAIDELVGLGEWEAAQNIMQKSLELEDVAEPLWDENKKEEAIESVDRLRLEISSIIRDTRQRMRIADIDRRTYEGVIAVLLALGVTRDTAISMATNNPHKMDVFTKNGFNIASTPVITDNAQSIAKHLAAKAAFLGHTIPKEVTSVIEGAEVVSTDVASDIEEPEVAKIV